MYINKYHVQVLVVEAVAVVLAGLIAFVVLWARTLSQAPRAEAFLREFTRLDVGKSTFEDAKSLAREYGGIPWWVSDNSMQCTYQRCVFRFVFENKPLTSTHLVPYTGLNADLFVKDGTIVGRDIHYFRVSKREFSYYVSESTSPAVTPQGIRMTGLARMRVDPKGVPSAVSIRLDPSSSEDQKRRAYLIDSSCLSRVLGCGGPSAIFPAAIPYRGEAVQTETEAW